MRRALQLLPQWNRRAPQREKEFARGLLRALRPPVLLRLERVHVRRQLRRTGKRRQILNPPSRQLGAIAEVEIFRERIVLPAARVTDRAGAEHAGCAVEGEEQTAAVARRLLDDELAAQS